MKESISDLKWRIYNVFPANELELEKLLSLVEIRYSDKTETAAVSLENPPVLVFNRNFVREHCKADEHLLVVLMHEMYHIILGHTRLFNRVTFIDNIAFDAVINAMICRSFPDGEYISFFQEFYKNTGIEALLRPPDNWSLDNISSARWKLKGDLLVLHKGLYTQEGDLTYRDIYDDLRKRVNIMKLIVLLGNHKGKTTSYDGQIENAISGIVGKWPALNPRDGRDQGMTTVERLLASTNRKDVVTRMMKKAILRLATERCGNLRVNLETDQDTFFPYPTIPDRKAAVLNTLGQKNLFYRGRTRRLAQTRAGRVHIYLDVSGSMDEYLERIFGSLAPLRSYLYPKIHAFSTEVFEHRPIEILNGKYRTNGGTDINCVAEHMVKNRIRKSAIITDGYVGPIREEFASQIKDGYGVVKILTPPHYKNEIDQIRGENYLLPMEEN